MPDHGHVPNSLCHRWMCNVKREIVVGAMSSRYTSHTVDLIYLIIILSTLACTPRTGSAVLKPEAERDGTPDPT